METELSGIQASLLFRFSLHSLASQQIGAVLALQPQPAGDTQEAVGSLPLFLFAFLGTTSLFTLTSFQVIMKLSLRSVATLSGFAALVASSLFLGTGAASAQTAPRYDRSYV